jgi:hypothetical protein
MMNLILKKTILISLLGHITFFGIFSFSFGYRMPKADYSSIVFWGQLLQNSQVAVPIIYGKDLKSLNFRERLGSLPTDNKLKHYNLQSKYYLKPQVTITIDSGKELFVEQAKTPLIFTRKRKPVIIFHPLLPYGFTLYFRDRQLAHVELMFLALSTGQGNSITVKRKISSGNLEVDLLSIRYIERYLFMQRANFASPNWQTVKIDLSAKND